MEKHSALQTAPVVESDSTNATDQDAHLTPKETRQIVTPYAFFVADELLGTPLAGPFRRGFGMLIDLLLVSLLTQVSSLVLAAIAAWTFFRAGNRLDTKKRFNGIRIILRVLVAVLVFIVAMGIVDEMTDHKILNDQPTAVSVNSVKGVDGIELMALTAKYLIDTKAMKQRIIQGDCEPAYACLQTLGEELVQDVVAIGLDGEAVDGVLDGYLSAVSDSLSPEQHTALTQHLQQIVQSKQAPTKSLEPVPIEKKSIAPAAQVVKNNGQDSKPKGLINWLQNLVEELGLGLGWAAFYFSIFTAWWKGQTPGKKLLGMKVIKLDNQPLNLWESFGRYGGYAAGLATGLTGFLQVFWDPNRQAIQDKISETLVIDLRKPKVSFIKDMEK